MEVVARDVVMMRAMSLHLVLIELEMGTRMTRDLRFKSESFKLESTTDDSV